MKKLLGLASFAILIPVCAFALTFDRYLVTGSTGSDVTALQQILAEQGFFSIQPTGYFGSVTAQAVAAFQSAHGLESVGEVGPQTRALLNSGPASQATGGSSGTTSLIATLMTQVQALEAQIAAIQGGSAIPAPTTTTSTGSAFTRTFGIGATGSDVSELQDLLRTKGYFQGDPTGYFGPLTSQALAKFQSDNDLEAVGAVGPKTLTLINNIFSVQGRQSSVPPQATSPAPKVAIPSVEGADNGHTSFSGGGGGGGGSSGSGGGGGGGGGGSSSSSGGSNGSSNNASYGNGPFAPFFANGTLAIPSGANVNAGSRVDVHGDVSMNVPAAHGNHVVTLKNNTTITNASGGTFDVTALTDADEATSSVTAPAGTVPVSVMQWGVPGTQLSLSQPVTIQLSVDSSFNGDTLSIYRSESAAGPWVQTGLSSTTCVVSGGVCQFDATSASHFGVFKNKPTVTISASPSNISVNGGTTLAWASTNSTSCVASNSWSGSKATSGTQTFSSLTSNQTYTLTCSNNVASVTQSASVTVAGAAPDTTPPSAPTNLSGTAGSQTQVTLSWKASTDNVGVTGYQVFRSSTMVATTTATSYANSGLAAATAYTYTVKATDAAGNISGASNQITVTTLAPAPTVSLSASLTSITSGQSSTLSYSSTNATSCTGTNFTPSGTAGTTSVSPTQTTTYTISCSGTGGSASKSVTVTVATAAVTGWVNTPFAAQTGTFTVSFDATPAQSLEDEVVGLSAAPAAAYTDLAAIVRFNDTGTIDVRDGANYAFGATINYSADQAYHFREVVNVPSHIYSVYVTQPGGSEILLASNYSFRTEQSSVTALANYGKFGSNVGNDATIANFSVTSTPVPTVSLAASPGSVTSGSSATLTYSSSNATNCTGTNFTPSGTSGSASVSPTQTTTYSIACTGAGGSASKSVTVTVTAASDTTAPSTPSNLSASAVSSSQINLAWTASTDNVGVTGYNIYRNGTKIGTASTNSYSDSGLSASTAYSYTVSAYDAAGNTSAQSSSASATTQAASSGSSGSSGSGGTASCPKSTTLADGCSGAPAATIQHATLLSTYAARPSWNVAGVDYGVGIPTGTVLKDPTVAGSLPNCASLDSTNHLIRVSSNCTLDGYDFSKGGSYTIYLVSGVSNVTVTNSNFTEYALQGDAGSSNVIFTHNNVDGQNNNGSTLLTMNGSGLTVEYNWMKNTSQHFFEVNGGGTMIVRYNMLEEGGLTAGAHLNYFQPQGTYSHPQVLFNTMLQHVQPAGGEGYQMYAGSITNGEIGYNTSITVPSGTCSASSGIISGCAESAVIHAGSTSANGTVHDNFFDDAGAYVAIYTGLSGFTYTNNCDVRTGKIINADNSESGSCGSAGTSGTTGTAATDTTAPSTPTNLSASAISTSQINLTWTASTDNVGVTGYNIYRNGAKIGTSATNSYSDSGLSASTAYSYTVSAYDAAGNVSAQSSSASATTASSGTSSGGGGTGGTSSTSYSLFTTQTPATVNISDGASVNYELGTKFTANVAGQITAIRFYKGSSETGTHTGHIWDASGNLLATVTFAGETASGWQTQNLTAPLAIAANTTYTVSVNTGGTYYVATDNGLASAVTDGPLSTVVGGDGTYGSVGAYPTTTYMASNYFRDVVFVPSAQTAAAGQAAPTLAQLLQALQRALAYLQAISR